MRCKSCDYPLWQIRDRRCPECGTGFVPSEFEFVLNSVRFCCPHCAQSYYGTGAKGHLVPSAFGCVSCRRPIAMDEMVLLPTAGVREEQTKVEMNPWLERREKGIVRGWFGTVIQSMGTPSRLARSTPERSSLLQATWFAALTTGFYLLLGLSAFVLMFLLIAVITAVTGGGSGGAGGVSTTLVPMFGFLALGLGVMIAILVGAFVWGAMAHGLLRLTGPVSAGIGRTMQCILYSSGTNVLHAVPCVGIYLGWLGTIWWAISATLMLKDGQKVSAGRAALAGILPPILTLLVGVGMFVALVVLPLRTAIAMAQVSATQTAAQTTQASGPGDAARIEQLAIAIKTHAGEYGAPPAHAAELISTQRIAVSEFLSPGLDFSSRMETVKIAGMTLDNVATADNDRTDAIVAAANASISPEVIAHRAGDTVFCYHGIDFATANPLLWTVVSAYEPGLRSWGATVVGLVDGTIVTFQPEEFAAALADQNSLRADAGLAPLPDPATVTVDKPAVSGK